MMRTPRLREAPNTKKRLVHLLHPLAEERGATATEYSIMVGFIALVITAGVSAFGIALDGRYNQLSMALKAALGIP